MISAVLVNQLLDAVYDDGVYYFWMRCRALNWIVKCYCDFKVL